MWLSTPVTLIVSKYIANKLLFQQYMNGKASQSRQVCVYERDRVWYINVIGLKSPLLLVLILIDWRPEWGEV